MTLNEALYLVTVIFVLLLLMSLSIYTIFLIYSWLKGAPYVATENDELREMFEKAGLKEGMVFIELGCGDGRVTRKAVRSYKVKGIGVDINPLLILYARFRAHIRKLKNIRFIWQDVRDVDISEADIIYIYLFPLLVQKLKRKLLQTTKRPVTIIAHGFSIDFLKEYQYDMKPGKHFKTYYYKL